LCIAAASLPAIAASGPALNVDAGAARHPISPDIYGINDYGDNGLAQTMRIPVNRWGGDAATRYNWLNDTYNSASDWWFETQIYNSDASKLPDGSAFDLFEEKNLSTRTKTIGTVPMLDWRTRARDASCSYSVSKYGPQQKQSPDRGGDCGNGYKPDGSTQIANDPKDASVPTDSSYQKQWVEYLVTKYAHAFRGGVQIWNLDNEPDWWCCVHQDIHPSYSTYDEILSRGLTYAQMIKSVDSTALVTGPVAAGWLGYFYSTTDFFSGWSTAPHQYWDNPVDRNAHGGVPLIEWYMQQMRKYEQQHGQRLLDYVDLHAYIAPNYCTNPNESKTCTSIGFGEAGSDALNTLRLTSTREFWDPNYTVPNNADIVLASADGKSAKAEPPRLIPRMLEWVKNDYPGTKTAITEYNWGALDDITGAIAQADIMGIFGREGLDLATLWGPPAAAKPGDNGAPPTPAQPGVYAFAIFLNYDGAGGRFGDTSVSATTGNPDQLSVFAAQRSDGALTVLVLNKTTGDLSSTVGLASFKAAGTAQVWRYSKANLNAIVRQNDATVGNAGIAATFPAYSMTLFVIPQQATSAKPVITAVQSAASYDAHAVSPGEIIILKGSNLGPGTISGAALTADGNFLTDSAAGVRVLFDGVPARLVYELNTQTAAIVPYFVALQPTTHIAVEYNGMRSDAFPMNVAAAVPAIFTSDYSGKGQGSILNDPKYGYAVNSPQHPAHAGDIVSIFATGEGQSYPPGVDGRIAIDIYPKPAATCTVKIGGVAAKTTWCAAAPHLTAGLLQVNAVVPSGVSGNSVTVVIEMGGVPSQAEVTMSVH